ncbi:MAG: type II toxin-antitoxin system VapC family toxin [Gammaproteobacteria bacterium]
MTAYPDTSFLCALYRPQDNSPDAAAHFKGMTEPLHVTSLLLYEFRQSLRFQVWRHTHDSKTGFPEADCDQALADLRSDLDSGAVVIAAADWADVHHTAERLSAAHTKAEGHRALDTLHVATALHLEAEEFLTFDERQRRLALAEGLAVKP